MKEVTRKKTYFGAYLPDNDSESIYNNGMYFSSKDNLKRYIPLVETFTCDFSTEVSLVDGNNKFNEIRGYNGNNNNRNLNEKAISKHRINLTQNDLSVGSQLLVFNFTNKNISIDTPNGLRKTYVPINNEKLSDYAGNIVFFEITALNTPSFISKLTGIDNYLNVLSEHFATNPSTDIKETYELYLFVENLLKEKSLDTRQFKSNSIKTVSLLELTSSDVAMMNDGDIFVAGHNLVVSFKSLVDISSNPSHKLSGFNTTDYQNILNLSGVGLFLNDCDNKIGDRFTYISGKSARIVSLKKNELAEGLYRTSFKNGAIRNEFISSLEDIDNLSYVYKTREEAMSGADTTSIYNDTIVKNKAELEHMRVESQRALVEQQVHYDRLMKEAQMELERVKASSTLTQHEAKNKREVMSTEHAERKNESDNYKEILKVLSETHKTNLDNGSMHRKNYYEEKRYERDSTVETIKTVAAIAGVVATGFLIYKKLV